MGGGRYILTAREIGPAWVVSFFRVQNQGKKSDGLGGGRKFTAIQLGTGMGGPKCTFTVQRFQARPLHPLLCELILHMQDWRGSGNSIAARMA